MAAILLFRKSSKTEKPALEPGHTAQILMYTGVRMERVDFEALRLAQDELLRKAN